MSAADTIAIELLCFQAAAPSKGLHSQFLAGFSSVYQAMCCLDPSDAPGTKWRKMEAKDSEKLSPHEEHAAAPF